VGAVSRTNATLSKKGLVSMRFTKPWGARIGPWWTRGSAHCGHLDRAIVDGEIGFVDTEIGHVDSEGCRSRAWSHGPPCPALVSVARLTSSVRVRPGKLRCLLAPARIDHVRATSLSEGDLRFFERRRLRSCACAISESRSGSGSLTSEQTATVSAARAPPKALAADRNPRSCAPHPRAS
jgi:hypothetical protein